MKKVLMISFLIFTILINLFGTSYAAVAVTKENLNESLQTFINSEANEDSYTSITVLDDVINITSDAETYTINYNLTDKPTFSFEIDIEKGISYEDFQDKTDTQSIVFLCYLAIANIQGVKLEDAAAYFAFSSIGNALTSSSGDNSYTIVDDLNTEDGVTIEKTDDPNIIYTSEFGDKVIEYLNSVYKDKQHISDSLGINSYSYTIEKQDLTDTSCKLVSTLIVNTDANFSEIIGYADKIGDSFIDSDITKENADYTVTLKIGQKCKLESTEEITGYVLSGNSIEISNDNTEFTATKVGTSTCRLDIGDNEKTFYIIVEENIENTTLDTITLKVDTDNSTDDKESLFSNILNSAQNIAENTNKAIINAQQQLNSIMGTTNKLPQTGDFFNIQDALFFLILTCAAGIIFLIIKNTKYKNTNK